MANVLFQNVSKIYPEGLKAVTDFTLDIIDKEFVVLVGPSGCGKSTTLRMVAGLEDISSGELYIGDKLVNTMPPKDRDISMVFQNYALYPHMNVYQNMAFGLKLHKISKSEIDRRVKETANTLGIETLLDRKPKTLSGGQRQRVALGRAIVREPKVFLMDEPLSNLDAKLRVQMRTEISKLHRRLQVTFIYVTHDQTEAMTMGDRIVVMREGIIQQADTPQNIYDYPENMFVAGFIGSPQMNFLDGELMRENGNLYFDMGHTRLLLPWEILSKIDEESIGKDVVMGIRPEHIHDDAGFLSRFEKYSIDMIVDVVEMMGAETFLYLTLGDNNLVARVDPRSCARPGDSIKVCFETDRMHLFDKETTKSMFKRN